MTGSFSATLVVVAVLEVYGLVWTTKALTVPRIPCELFSQELQGWLESVNMSLDCCLTTIGYLSHLKCSYWNVLYLFFSFNCQKKTQFTISKNRMENCCLKIRDVIVWISRKFYFYFIFIFFFISECCILTFGFQNY